ncbi:RNase H family protein [Dermabacter sp. Marseille-Q3180]|uniref:RNase H family protein n=1 Tax=Dermabacter sp. Marseille-Q3180 TaxID=2758090 RepID=UPI002024774F|nr:RNase H family protein [Dermabacter sp. Marseille-Q3180]
MTITAAADGSALGNPGPTGWAWYVSEDCWSAGGSAHGTNNIGELTAVRELLSQSREAGHEGEDLVILCDSQYVINSVTKWMPGWKKKGWKKKDGKPVLNVELMQAIDREMQGRNVRFEWVKGHAGHDMNEAADERARAAATAYQKGTAPNEGPGFAGAGRTAQGEEKSPTPASLERSLWCESAPPRESLGESPHLIDTRARQMSPEEWTKGVEALRSRDVTIRGDAISREVGPNLHLTDTVLEAAGRNFRIVTLWGGETPRILHQQWSALS